MPRPVEEPAPSRPAYFWWLLANALALCFAVVSWVVCLDVFGHPEAPRNYQILKKLGRLPVPKRYSMTDVPNGNAHTPKELYKRYFALTDEQRAQMNPLLLRNYLANFDQSLLLTYVEGDYRIEQARALTPDDILSPGIVVRVQALSKPDDFTPPMPYPVFVEYVIPTADVEAASAFKPGETLTLKKSPNCAVVIHVAKTLQDDEPALLLTAIPIVAGPHQAGSSDVVKVEPPAEIRPGAGLPVIRDENLVQP